MATVELLSVGKSIGPSRILSDINLKVADGEFVVFVGPSGCGKSTLLRVVAGLESASSGEIQIGGRRVNETSPAARGVAMVFQSYALYPHMTVRENMAFCLKLAGADRSAIDTAVTRAAGILAIEPLLSRRPASLSGGQRQRVAIGRAIVRQPEVFLFDEPLSNLDAALRVRMRYEFAKLHQDLKTTMIYVTHDQVEAMTLADRIVVLSAGRIEQIGAPMELYERPDNLFVAGFIGSPKMNFLDAVIVTGRPHEATVRLASGETLTVAVDAGRTEVGDPVTLGVRAEDFVVGGAENALSARVKFVELLGNTTFAYAEVVGARDDLTVQLSGQTTVRAGETLLLGVRPECCHLFDAEGRALTRRPIVLN